MYGKEYLLLLLLIIFATLLGTYNQLAIRRDYFVSKCFNAVKRYIERKKISASRKCMSSKKIITANNTIRIFKKKGISYSG